MKKETTPYRKAPYPDLRQHLFFDKKSHRALVFLARMINMIIARTVSLSTGKNGYGETVIRPHPEEGRVALRTELHSHLLWP